MEDRARNPISGVHDVLLCVETMDQIANRSPKIVRVVEMGGDEQTHIFADPYEIPTTAQGSTRGRPTAKLTSDNASLSIIRGIRSR